MSFAERILEFYSTLEYNGNLPNGVGVMNPFRENAHAFNLAQQFYTKYFDDENRRYIILGINPGRFGAGATGIPFTDTLRLNEKCGIPFGGFRTYEPSSAFIYDMIESYGSVDHFYNKFFISAICPLGFTIENKKGKAVNYNYYDSSELTRMVYPFILSTLKQQLEFGIDRSVCFCLGTGKNDAFLRKLNSEFHFFGSIITLEHPRFIMQYRARKKEEYVKKYVDVLTMC